MLKNFHFRKCYYILELYGGFCIRYIVRMSSTCFILKSFEGNIVMLYVISNRKTNNKSTSIN